MKNKIPVITGKTRVPTYSGGQNGLKGVFEYKEVGITFWRNVIPDIRLKFLKSKI